LGAETSPGATRNAGCDQARDARPESGVKGPVVIFIIGEPPFVAEQVKLDRGWISATGRFRTRSGARILLGKPVSRIWPARRVSSIRPDDLNDEEEAA
jgi:hypothetical protein